MEERAWHVERETVMKEKKKRPKSDHETTPEKEYATETEKHFQI